MVESTSRLPPLLARAGPESTPYKADDLLSGRIATVQKTGWEGKNGPLHSIVKKYSWTENLFKIINHLMSTITYSTARDHLAEVWDKTISTREPVVVSRRGTESIVLVPVEEWEALQETAHLLRSPANARRLLAALSRLDQGEGEQLSIESLADRAGLK